MQLFRKRKKDASVSGMDRAEGTAASPTSSQVLVSSRIHPSSITSAESLVT